MRHHVDNRKLGRTTAHRLAMFSNMLCSLVERDRIETTLPKAKELRRFADKLVTLGKRKTLHARRRAFQMVKNHGAVKKIFDDLASRFASRNGGYTRILKLGFRHGDSAPMAMIEYLESPEKAKQREAEATHAKKQKAKAKLKPEKKTAKEAVAPKKEARSKIGSRQAPRARQETKKRGTSRTKD